ncbi:MAG: hypothetical protein N3B16_09780 [Candidatus Aminicenantes bacterium]|nr:hypothetical protein [Candidatus Aminicenantes bacterium]
MSIIPLNPKHIYFGIFPTTQRLIFFTEQLKVDIMLKKMINYLLLYKIRKRVKKIIQEKIEDGELSTTPKSCLGCLADDITWEIYYLLKEKEKGEK